MIISSNIEIFRTDVSDKAEAARLVKKLEATFAAYQVNFDLHDCDRILRVESAEGEIAAEQLISLLKQYGCSAILL